jgi:hypothetical protein
MEQYRKKPVEITAVQLTTENIYDVLKWANSIQPEDKRVVIARSPFVGKHGGYIIGLHIPTKEGEMLCAIGDYLIKEPFPTDDRMFYPCKPDMFELTYDRIPDTI